MNNIIQKPGWFFFSMWLCLSGLSLYYRPDFPFLDRILAFLALGAGVLLIAQQPWHELKAHYDWILMASWLVLYGFANLFNLVTPAVFVFLTALSVITGLVHLYLNRASLRKNQPVIYLSLWWVVGALYQASNFTFRNSDLFFHLLYIAAGAYISIGPDEDLIHPSEHPDAQFSRHTPVPES